LSGICEADELYLNGKIRHRNLERGFKKGPTGTGASVVGVVQREGDVRLRHVTRVNAENVHKFLLENVDTSARVMTDENPIYRRLPDIFQGGHDTVCHRMKEYARGEVSTNRAEGAFSLIKRGMFGIYHSVSHEHLHRYLSEFEFRYNARKVSDAE